MPFQKGNKLWRLAQHSSGKKHPMYNHQYSQETITKMRLAKLGKKQSPEHISKRVMQLKGRPNLKNRGELSGRWKGGTSSVTQSIRACWKYKEWLLKCYQRDNYICQNCLKNKHPKDVHHIKLVKDIIKENRISNIEEAILCKELWDVDNGITLCRGCHYKIHYKRIQNEK